MIDEIINLEEGYAKVHKNGIEPFIALIERQERQFFRAQDFIPLYDLIFKMCIQRDPYNWSEQMYERYTKAISEYLLTKVGPSFLKARDTYDIAFLNEWRLRWKNQKLIVEGLRKLFMYLDRFYTPNTDGVRELKEQGFWLYKEHIFDNYKKFARQAVLNCIEKERQNEPQDRDLLHESVDVFVEMGYNFNNQKLKVYRTDLEKFILDHAAAFYKRQSRFWMDQDSCPNYLKKAEKMLQAEKNRVEQYLHRTSMEPLQKACHQELLKVHQQELLTKKTGVDHLLSTDAREDLSRMYRLYAKYPEDLQPIADLMGGHIQRAGEEIVKKANPQGHDLVTKLITLHAQYADVVAQCFDRSQVFQKALKKAFEDFINQDDRVSRLLANFINDVLTRGTNVNLTESVEKTLDNVVFLYGYIQEKDIFERHYQLFLSHRLLNGLCDSEHVEKTMISKLKTEAGYQWCNKLEGMFKDIQMSKDLMSKFKAHSVAESAALELSVNVCSSGYWPTSTNIPYHLPQELSTACDKFKRFYLSQHNGHKLIWHMDQGRAEVLVHFAPKVSRTLVLTTYQMMIMLIFNTQKTCTFKQILDFTGVPKYDMAHHLLSLAHPKVSVLLKRPASKTLEEDHQFMINGKYVNKLLKVVIPLMPPLKREGDEGGDEELKVIEMQRRHQMDAAIVRIMKIRKTMKHPALVAEVISQLKARFTPKPGDIKKRIEALIEQEYLERDKQDRSVYKYLA